MERGCWNEFRFTKRQCKSAYDTIPEQIRFIKWDSIGGLHVTKLFKLICKGKWAGRCILSFCKR